MDKHKGAVDLGKILVVDDQVGIRMLIQEVLKNEGHEIKTASTGLEAVSLIQGKHFDTLLLDMQLPGMTGVEILEETKECLQNTKIMMMTAYGEQSLVERAKSLGVVHFFTKPFNIVELRTTVNNLM